MSRGSGPTEPAPRLTAPRRRPRRDVPAAVGASAAELAARLGTGWRFLPRYPGDTAWVATGRHHVVYLADGDADRARIRRETEALTWCAKHGVPVPDVVAAAPGGEHLVATRVPEDPPEGAAYVDAAVAAADALAAAPPPPGADTVHARLTGSRRRRSRTGAILGKAASAGLLASVGLAPPRVRAARRAALGLPDDTLSHGDFRAPNVLFDAARGRVAVIDFEQLRLAPFGHDHLMLWTSLVARSDRDRVLTILADGRSAARRAELTVLHRWVAYRAAAGLLTEFPGDRGVRRRARCLVAEVETSVLVRGDGRP